MPKFVIEREIPGAGKLSPQELQAVSQTSCQVLRELGPQVQWLQTTCTAMRKCWMSPPVTVMRLWRRRDVVVR